MKRPLLMIVLIAFVLVTGGAMAVMNGACKSTQHPWCAPMPAARHQTARN
jgi:hypothetical protein